MQYVKSICVKYAVMQKVDWPCWYAVMQKIDQVCSYAETK